MIINEKKSFFLRKFVEACAALFFALFVSGIIILVSGNDPLKAFQALITGSVGSVDSIILSLQKTIPLIFTGLSVAIGFKCGLFNIGAEGQLYIGAIIAAWSGLFFPDLSGFIKLPFILLLSILGGALWGFFPGYLKAKKGVHEVLTTIMMNYAAIHLTLLLVKGPLRGDPHIVKTEMLPASSRLPVLFSSGALTLSLGLFIAVLIAFALHFFLNSTTYGYKIRAVGRSREAARAAGFNVKRLIILAMVIAGGLAGLGGAVEVTGLHHTFYGQFSPGYGFDGIAVALLASNNPIAVIFTAFLFGALRAADRTMQLSAGVPHQLVLIIQGLVILFVGIRYFFSRYLKNKKLKRVENV